MNDLEWEEDERVAQLIEEFDFHPLTAKIYVAYNGKCVYCGMDLLASSVEYYSGIIDRLLPIDKYPELEWAENNLVLCCFSCSNIKGGFNVLNAVGPNLPELLQTNKETLINKIMKELSNRIQTIENERNRVKQIIRGNDNSR